MYRCLSLCLLLAAIACSWGCGTGGYEQRLNEGNAQRAKAEADAAAGNKPAPAANNPAPAQGAAK